MSNEDQNMGLPVLAPVPLPPNPNFQNPLLNFIFPGPNPANALPANTPEWITLFQMMMNQMNTIVANQAPAPAPCTAPVLQNMVKFSDPCRFSGKSKDVDTYVKNIQSCINNATEMFPNDVLKTSFFGCWLGVGVPEKWFYAIVGGIMVCC